ncbi:MAG: hypothetical protein OXH77_06420, partial [Anaerolineaceae bacterium]|nr:hypothetical protein [Anaerolineaceae bacterium]
PGAGSGLWVAWALASMNCALANEIGIEYRVQPGSYVVPHAAMTTLRLSAMPQKNRINHHARAVAGPCA